MHFDIFDMNTLQKKLVSGMFLERTEKINI